MSFLRDCFMYLLFKCFGKNQNFLVIIYLARAPEKDSKFVYRISGPGIFSNLTPYSELELYDIILLVYAYFEL